MQTDTVFEPLHIALKYVAATCIDEGLTDDAEAMANYLDLIGLAPRTVGLLQIWTMSQRGQLRDALRVCEAMASQFPDAEEFQPVLAVLGYACNESQWRSTCSRMIESPNVSVENKKLMDTLMDGTFGKATPEKEELEAESPANDTNFVDYAAVSGYLRA